jgi:hypothetical protein
MVFSEVCDGFDVNAFNRDVHLFVLRPLAIPNLNEQSKPTCS